MQYGLKQIGIAALRDALEETAPNHREAPTETAAAQRFADPVNDLRLVEQHPLRTCMEIEDRLEQQAAPAADVNNAIETRKIVGGRDRARNGGRDSRHGPVENLALLIVDLAIRPGIGSVHETEC